MIQANPFAHPEPSQGDSSIHVAGITGIRPAHTRRRVHQRPRCRGSRPLLSSPIWAVSIVPQWAARLIWGNQLVSGRRPEPNANAWATDVTWGAATTPAGENIEWGLICRDKELRQRIRNGRRGALSAPNAGCSTVSLGAVAILSTSSGAPNAAALIVESGARTKAKPWCGEAQTTRQSCGEATKARPSCGEATTAKRSCGEATNTRRWCGDPAAAIRPVSL